MSNWCINRLEVYGSIEELARFVQEAESISENNELVPLTFSALVPQPDVLNEEDAVSWRREHWGVKWDLSSSTSSTISTDQATYEFDTPWAPPIAWVDKVAAMYPELTFDLFYYELGMFFAGSIKYRKGVLHAIEEYDTEDDVSEFLLDYFDYDISELLEANG